MQSLHLNADPHVFKFVLSTCPKLYSIQNVIIWWRYYSYHVFLVFADLAFRLDFMVLFTKWNGLGFFRLTIFHLLLEVFSWDQWGCSSESFRAHTIQMQAQFFLKNYLFSHGYPDPALLIPAGLVCMLLSLPGEK